MSVLDTSLKDFEQVVFCHDEKVGLKAVIAIHSTVLGPGVGGCRMWNYASEQEGLNDALRLSKGMTYKAAISDLNWGGGKSVIFGDPKKDKSKALFERFGEFVDRLGGFYVTAKDVGIGAEDLSIIKNKTEHVLGIQGESGSSGDPSPATAWGVFHGIKSAAKVGLKTDSLAGVKIAVQGLGSVGFYLCGHLIKAGAKITATDIDPQSLQRAQKEYGIEVVSPDKIYDLDCDIYSPNALGATINAGTRKRIKAKVIAGGANNQLATPEDGEALHRSGVVYAPDYAINAGGLINIYYEGGVEGGYNKERAYNHVERIGQTITQILTRSQSENVPSFIVADHIVEERLEKARQKKRT